MPAGFAIDINGANRYIALVGKRFPDGMAAAAAE
jgi:hypothetical protein